jgi:hypothetical protein
MESENVYKTIIIANGAEAFEDVLNKIRDKKERKQKIMLEHNLSGRALFWESNSKVIVTPYPIQNSLINKSIEFGLSNIKNLAPLKICISLSRAIMADSSLWNSIVKIIRNNPGIKISPYSVTEEFLVLAKNLKKKNLDFSVSEKPELNSEWTISYLDSKVGFRTEMLRVQSFLKEEIIPEGFICKDKKEALDVAKWFYKSKRSCVLKVNYGESGWGLIIAKRSNFNSILNLEKELKKRLNFNLIWNNTLIVVEEFIKSNMNVERDSPSVEIFVDNSGPKITYSCGQLLVDQKEFVGVVMGKDFFNANINSKLHKISSAIGKEYWKLGYRGFFDIDFVVSSQGKPYVIETNMRRTGGTHVFDIAKTIFGQKWEEKAYFISQDSFKYGNKILSDNILLDKISHVLYPIKSEKKGVIVTIIDRWAPTFGFVIVASTSEEAKSIYSKLFNFWHK